VLILFLHAGTRQRQRLFHPARLTAVHQRSRTNRVGEFLFGLLRHYLANHWKPNVLGLVFPNRKGTRPRSRDNVVKYGLKPILKALKMPTKEVGLHAFRHGLATELADASAPLPVLQRQMRHADVRTTLRIYSHLALETHRECMEKIGQRSIGTNVPIVTEQNA